MPTDMQRKSAGDDRDEGTRQGELVTCQKTGHTSVFRFLTNGMVDNERAHRIGEEMVRFAQQDRPRQIIVDFTGLKQVPSSLLSRLIMLYRTVKKWDGRIEVRSLGPEARRSYNFLNLHRLMPICRDEEHEG